MHTWYIFQKQIFCKRVYIYISITKSYAYRKAPSSAMSDILTTEKQIAESLDLDDRIDAFAEKEAFVTLKDHKPNFANNPSCRIINPAKSEIGIISQKILQRINSEVVKATGLNQWKNTHSVIEWFKNIQSKPTHSFICFDIIEFYPSITEDLLRKALEFAATHAEISDQDRDIIIKAKSSLLFNKSEAWCKRATESLFDVTMGSFDGAETCELVGSYLLHSSHRNTTKRSGCTATTDWLPWMLHQGLCKKIICRTFSENNLRLTIEANKKCVNYLDITLDLSSGTFRPYTKPNNTPQYVHCDSNHPRSNMRNIPEGINRRLSNISSDEQAFDSAIPPYQEVLKKSSYDHQLRFNQSPPKTKRKRSRNVTWYNPP